MITHYYEAVFGIIRFWHYYEAGFVIYQYNLLKTVLVRQTQFTLWKLCASGSDANTFACLVRLALRCG